MATKELGVAGLGVSFGECVEDGAFHERWLGEPGNASCPPLVQALPGIPVWHLHRAAFSSEETRGNPNSGRMLFLKVPLGRGPEVQRETGKANSQNPRAESSLQSMGILWLGLD